MNMRLIQIILILLFASACGAGDAETAVLMEGVTPAAATVTQTEAPTVTVTPTPEELTATPQGDLISTEESLCTPSIPTSRSTYQEIPTSSRPTGYIISWNYPPYYIRFEANEGFVENTEVIGMRSERGRSPDEAVTAAFSRYSQQIAYIINLGRNELWIADLNLTNVTCVWSDNTNWLGDIALGEEVQIRWGPLDKSIIITSLIMNSNTLILDLETLETNLISGSCDQIGYFNESRQLDLWCFD
ncbi:MAG: hypothetical protein FVQ83_09375 [Chloroflexi bacterium]|nr:hypothetical protein [Chloroflexota bacterium]